MLLVIMLFGIAASFTGCIFNNGSDKELEGVYGLELYYFKSKNGVVHDFGPQYDYLILVLYKDKKSAKLISKPVDGSETVLDLTFTINYNGNKVESIFFENFGITTYQANAQGLTPKPNQNLTLALFPKREDLQFSENALVRNDEGAVVTAKNLVRFHKIYERTTDRKIEKAKKKQIDDRTDRAFKTDSND